MDRIKGTVVEILAADTILVDVAFIGKFNAHNLPDVVKIRFSDLSPPYLRDATPEQAVSVLNNRLLGQRISANIGAPDAEGDFRGKVVCEGSFYRG